jgi:hypothetical protein
VKMDFSSTRLMADITGGQHIETGPVRRAWFPP